MNKALFVVRVDNYFPELCQYTIPTIKDYANRIKAEYIEITERKYPEFPATYEKVQVYKLGEQFDQVTLVDADFMIHPKAPDITRFVDIQVGAFSAFDAKSMFEMDKYFIRDGRNIGIATGFVMTSKLTHDLWTPLEFGWDIAQKKTYRPFIVDEYCLSRNLAKFGLKFTGLHYNDSAKQVFVHLGVEEKSPEAREEVVGKAKTLLKTWGI